ncbi:MAG TPA: sulfatase-like hydrolase/transferase [Chloroflexota bacterium]|nr:sulfatase-like hydrolase/transferase [Chloroflexota bacterium]
MSAERHDRGAGADHTTERREPAMPRITRAALLESVLALAAASVRRPAPAQALSAKPNIVLFITDDQDVASLPAMGRLSGYEEGSWIRLDNAFANHSLCCPSRVTLLTGLHSHVHGIVRNDLADTFDDSNTLAVWLKNGGYRTGLIGKYLNGFPWQRGKTYVPPGWDYFTTYGNPDLVTKLASDFVAQSTGPFFLYVSYNGPHQPAQPLTRYQTSDVYVPPDSPNFNEADVSDKPGEVRNLPLLDQPTIDAWHAERIASQRELLGIDESMQNVIGALKAKGVLDNTIIFFTADHGFSWGSHRLIGKICPYEECSRVPFFVRYPGQAGSRVDRRLVSIVDLAPTIAQLAGVTPGVPLNGKSIVPVLTNAAAAWDDAVLLEVPERWFGIRTPGWKYIQYNNGKQELYDLNADPAELTNLADAPPYLTRLSELAQRLQALKAASSSGPSVSISNYKDGALVRGTRSVKIAVEGMVVLRVDLLADQRIVGSTSTFPYEVSWDTRSMSDGGHTLSASVYDTAGRSQTCQPVSVIVDNTPPTVAITSPATGATVAGLVAVSVTAADASGIREVSLFIDGVRKATTTTSPYAFEWDTTTALNGNHAITSKAIDRAGNSRASSVVSVVVRN